MALQYGKKWGIISSHYKIRIFLKHRSSFERDHVFLLIPWLSFGKKSLFAVVQFGARIFYVPKFQHTRMQGSKYLLSPICASKASILEFQNHYHAIINLIYR